jgi:hypothetical protein
VDSALPITIWKVALLSSLGGGESFYLAPYRLMIRSKEPSNISLAQWTLTQEQDAPSSLPLELNLDL